MIDTQKVSKILNVMGKTIRENKEPLSELDREIGDGDHGINMARGFEEVEKKLSKSTPADIGGMLNAAGMALAFKVGGASGPLYGSAFMAAGKKAAGKTELDLPLFADIMEAAVEAVKRMGKSDAGDKTMLDAMIPVCQSLREAELDALKDSPEQAKDLLNKALAKAWEGVEYTKGIKARKGRASYLGERSIGHRDPGAVSFSLLFECICNVLGGKDDIHVVTIEKAEAAEAEPEEKGRVGVVVVSHSKLLAEGIADLAKMMSPETEIHLAGGLPDGSYGTSPELIKEAIKKADHGSGVVIFADLGSAILSSETVIAEFTDKKIAFCNAPVCEGAAAAALSASVGMDFEEVMAEGSRAGDSYK